jgi:hypothetical protein
MPIYEVEVQVETSRRVLVEADTAAEAADLGKQEVLNLVGGITSSYQILEIEKIEEETT